ncbi:hypothetical protein NDU88_000138 [Pleurodeles waltl]|uniref:Uncharacterized protein n=1 Tax=Pleurodeles waltl TaxID=8319 RepID=A0AAV7UP50_PLEWA|nr:hypothetical protein NDU88_000138 [Pleurodeles waltl]
MVARAAPREQEELLKDALSRTVKTPRVRRETVERLALRGIEALLCFLEQLLVHAQVRNPKLCEKIIMISKTSSGSEAAEAVDASLGIRGCYSGYIADVKERMEKRLLQQQYCICHRKRAVYLIISKSVLRGGSSRAILFEGVIL